MKTRRILAGLIALLMTGSLTPAFAAEGEWDPDIKVTADLLVTKNGATSVQYALWDNGEITLSGQAGVYSRTENRALTNQDMYGIGSVSKVYTTAAVMKLVEEGKLDLDQPVVQYLPEFTMKDARYLQITVRMLLNHSSGLYGSSLQNAMLFGDHDTYAHDTLLNKLAGQTLKADPGAFSVYCNDGFSLAELVVERVTGMDFTDYIHQTFTAPLGLKNTKTTQDSFDPAQLVRAYSPLFMQELPTDMVNQIGTGGIYASAEDLSVFGGLLTGANPGILSSESAKQMQQPEYQKGLWPEAAANNTGYGLGWDSVDMAPLSEKGIAVLNKGGDTQFFHAALVAIPEYGLSAAVLSSGGSSSVNTLFAQKILIDALRQKGVDVEFAAEEPVKAVRVDMPQEMEEFSGYYGATGAAVKVIVKDGELRVPMSDDPAEDQVYVYTGDGAFSTEYGDLIMRFVTRENGKTYLQVTAQANMEHFPSMVSSYYDSEKLEQNVIPDDVKAVWDSRNGKQYYVLNEKYTSQLVMAMPHFLISFNTEMGYANGCKIVDADTAVNVFEVPVSHGRDSFDLNFWNEGGTEYLQKSDSIYIREDAIPAIWGGTESTCTIQPDGYIRWYRAGDDSAAKTMTVNIPEGGSFLVFTDKGRCIEYSTISGGKTSIIPEGGKMAFIGSPGAVFDITME